ncbi:MAG TPA: CBS domain-containing protein [Nocardioidaceae bacterium]|jgi:CBS domain-containing protein|nr:CBS domain-containing protein [Nocardioidaceae bacterium]
MRISEVLGGKGSQDVVTVRPEATVRELLALLAEHNIGAVVVSSDGVALDGIVSERDVVRRLNEDETALDQPVSSIMSAQVHTCERSQPVHDLMVAMTERRIRHVPVVEDGRLVGIVSIGDVVKSRMGELEFERDQLDSYVHTGQS